MTQTTAGAAVVELSVTGVAHGGWCVGREPGGRVVFVRHALPGEQVSARITEETATFARAETVDVLMASPDRVTPPCPYAKPGGCGGCDWQHASLAAQRRLKADVVGEQLRRIAGIDQPVTVEPVAGDQDGLGWRTRVRFTVGPDGAAGLLAHRSHEVVKVADCLIAHPLVEAAGVAAQHWESAASVEVAVSPAAGQRVVTTAGERGHRRRHSGPSHLRHVAAGRDWRVGAATFWQVHPGAADLLATAVADALCPVPGDVVLDLYCGAGLFAGTLAAAVGPHGTVIGVDTDRMAVRDARHNLQDFPWARVHVGEAAEALARGGWPPATLAVLDPPRTGVTRAVIERLVAPAALRRVAYVSCDPATLARDIAVFARLGWQLAGLRAFDIFPMTHHVECLAVLTRAGAPG
ncbi:MAG TPA: TRAM domain-containing protein [Streptosporangiaceae bacterium]|nr:TRAM domain-containing protein [Streptosporangiaceae bacterium]